ncbi:MAG: hypothetical protein P9M15_07715, partial [Candidatus Electryoneaceae bacterium]|nr:hypothetical protein [Candidatus Electryoneaceae bacterium]
LNSNSRIEYDEDLCRLVHGENVDIWNSCWLIDEITELVDPARMIDKEKLGKVTSVIENSETALFIYGS